MTTEHDPRTRVVLSWLREEAHENPEHVLLRALDEVDATPQRRSWPAWRSNRMNPYAKLILAAAAVLLVAVVGYQFLPSNGGVGGQPTIEPSPSPSLLARGTFTAHGITAELDATGSGADVAGTMALSEANTDNRATVDLECARTTAEGLIEIGGLLTESAWDPNAQDWNDGFPKGQRVAIIFEPGSPVKAIWNVTAADQGVTSCEAMFVNLDSGDPILPGSPGLDPIQGTVEFGPSSSPSPSEAVDFPAMTTTFVSPTYRYSFKYLDRGGLAPASELWDPANQPIADRNLDDRFDAVETGLAAYFEGASTQLPDRISIDAWVDEYVTPPVAGGCGVPRSQQAEIIIDGQSGRMMECGHTEATVVAGGRLFLFIGPGDSPRNRAWFQAWIATIDLRPEDASVPSSTPSS